ncbi:class I SAM-dependent methyltransferase [Tamlana sp. I1]|uniref:class I SAM-dependent methyltransferase n=1 Tax=Tamlana sp. I1 TaxID=2762061 RepID=UPI0018908346|nr:class I SAM-dependent methyltransferase [Tamlana sp. I1]
MYNTLKNIAKALIPNKFLIKNELLFRNVFSFFYIGKNHECQICNNTLKAFVPLNENDLICPCCGSLSRNRRLWALIKNDANINGKILHFSPSRSLFRKLKQAYKSNYFSSDFESEFIADYKFDITQINQENHTFDLIICYHILEHILDDQKAMNELYRVLKPGGTIYIQTPFKTGEIYEDASIVLPEEREKHFGQNDHVRIYSVKGLTNRLENSGFKVNVKTYNKEQDDFYFGLKSPETVLIASK